MAVVETLAPPVSTAPAPDLQRSRLQKITRSYTLRVVLQGLITILAVTTFTFFLIRLLPGNPIQVKIDQLMERQGMTYEQALNQASSLFQFDPKKPLVEQYFDYVSHLVRGDLGLSIVSTGTSVSQQILRFLPWTLFCVGLGLLISFTVGMFLGMAMAYWRGSVFDNVMTAVASILYGIPDYVFALLIIIVLGVQLGLFNPGEMRGGVDPNVTPGFTFEYLGSILRFALLPVTTYVLASVGSWVLAMKSSTLSTLGEDYIAVAKARGLSERRILLGYIGRNAMLPLITRLAISIGFVVGGAVIVEELFQYPGLGRALLKAINQRDYTTMQGIFLIISVMVVFANTLSDLVFGWLDPRVRLGKENSE